MRSSGQRYRRRRPLPAILLVLVLGLIATVVWLKVMNTEGEVAGPAHCAPPKTKPTVPAGRPAPTLGKPLEPASLERTDPAAPSSALVRVVNGSGRRGLAGVATETLRGLGFTQVTEPVNDPLYNDSLTCRAQIRFGAQGTAAARTLSLVEPCAELVRDDRKDATVELALGDKFDELDPNRAASTLLEQLNDFAKQNPSDQGGLQANAPRPSLDSGLLAAARKVRC